MGLCRLLQETKRCISRGVRMHFVLNKKQRTTGNAFQGEKEQTLFGKVQC